MRTWQCASIIAVMQLCSCRGPQPSNRGASWNQRTGVFRWQGGEVTLPAGLRYRQDVGADSFEGHFTSPDGKIMVRHDIGGYAGVFANRRDAVAFEERVIDGSRAWIAQLKWPDGPVATTFMFAVTFPDNGCANFFLTSNNVADAWPIQRIAQSFRPKEKSDGGLSCALVR